MSTKMEEEFLYAGHGQAIFGGAAHAAMSSAAWQEIRVRSGRDDHSRGESALTHLVIYLYAHSYQAV
jgi:hypothetical protein